VGDSVVVNLCMVLGVAIVGFMLVNFPRGLMFLGDGAAYFIGFALAQIWMLLLARNTEISTWFVVAVAAHPTMETVFSMYRRRVYGRRGGAFTAADRLHLHSLVYRRRTLALVHRMPWLPRWAPNALAACMVMGIALLPMLAASAAPNSSAWCAGVAAASAFGYVLCFRHLIGFGSIRRRAVPAVQSGLVSTASPQ
jgi:UDP-N-acetylmuramyl pentapeptide phosphotransferase/UDP-N-acetylglucosamine-1-phosphate transferase